MNCLILVGSVSLSRYHIPQKNFARKENIPIFASIEPAKPLSNAQIGGSFFIYMGTVAFTKTYLNPAQHIYGTWSSSHRTGNAQVVQVNSREAIGILHREHSHRVSRGTTIQSYAAPSSSPILFDSYLA